MGGVTVDCLDFTRGKSRTRKSTFAPEARGRIESIGRKEARGVDHLS
jgi:hypothetical protein